MDDHPPETVAAVAPFNFLQQLQVNRHCSKPSKRLCPAAPYYQPQKLIRAVYIKRLLLVVLNIGEIIYNNIIHRALFVGEIHPTFPVKTVTFSLSLLVPSFSWSYLSLDPWAASGKLDRPISFCACDKTPAHPTLPHIQSQPGMDLTQTIHSTDWFQLKNTFERSY